jgi:hypothetical protein
MRGAINLHRQSSRRAIEIENIGSHRVLPSKAKTIQAAAAETVPEDDLWQRHFTTQGPRPFEC